MALALSLTLTLALYLNLIRVGKVDVDVPVLGLERGDVEVDFLGTAPGIEHSLSVLSEVNDDVSL